MYWCRVQPTRAAPHWFLVKSVIVKIGTQRKSWMKKNNTAVMPYTLVELKSDEKTPTQQVATSTCKKKDTTHRKRLVSLHKMSPHIAMNPPLADFFSVFCSWNFTVVPLFSRFEMLLHVGWNWFLTSALHNRCFARNILKWLCRPDFKCWTISEVGSKSSSAVESSGVCCFFICRRCYSERSCVFGAYCCSVVIH